MPIQNAEDLFLNMLSSLHASEQRLQRAMEELSQAVQEQDVKDVLSVRAYLTKQNVSNIEKCFQLLGKEPTKVEWRFGEVWVQDTIREIHALQNPTLKALYALNAVRKIQDFHIREYEGLTTIASLMGNEPVATLLEHSMADKVQFVERTREMFRDLCRTALGARLKEKVRERMAS